MKRADREGHCAAYMIDGSGRYILTREHYAPLLAAWMAGQAFYTGADHYGAPITIKLARVEGVIDNSPAVCAAVLADEEADRQERLLHGDG